MASNNFDFLDDFGIKQGESPENVYEEFVKEVGEKVTKDLREYIEQNASNTGGLASSVVYLPNGKLSFEVKADSYYKFVDEGVNGLNSNMGSQYSFKLPYVTSKHARAIQEWKGLSLNNAYAVAMNNKKKGIKGKRITDNVLTDDVLDKISKDLAEVTGINFTLTFEKNTKQWQ
tara:strand:+ start:1078 stop:1599 length:522 start_codon:yes stop_codon:yes gene_type:complete